MPRLDGIEFGTHRRQPAEFDVQFFRQLTGGCRGVRCAAIEKENDVPPPLAAEMGEVVAERIAVPLRYHIDAVRAGRDVERREEDGFPPVAFDRDLGRIVDLRPTGPQRRRFGDDGGIGRQDHILLAR